MSREPQKWDALIASYLAVLPRLMKRANDANDAVATVEGEIANLRELQREAAEKEAA